MATPERGRRRVWSAENAELLLKSDDVPSRLCGVFILWLRAVVLGVICGTLLVGLILAIAAIVEALT